MTQANLKTMGFNTDPQDPAGAARHGADRREQAPIWLAALEAAGCRALARGMHHEVRWHAAAGRAIYTNDGRHPEWIEPLDVILPAGNTLAVHWAPGATEFTLEVWADREKCA
ncbi:MAG: hypothetical protein KGN36_20750 [Acidobacteriota bacterium]|nr:hypothetical protein [Acidobacteriota bacterium]